MSLSSASWCILIDLPLPSPFPAGQVLRLLLGSLVEKHFPEYYIKFLSYAFRSHHFQVIYYGRQSPSGGTSAAAPVVAGIVGLLNDARFRAGLPSLGFLNPWLYSSGYKGLNDITMGGSVGCQGINPQVGTVLPGASVIPYASWNATVGWDPVTGLGTPNFQELLGMVLELKKGSGRCRYFGRGPGHGGGGW